MLIQDILKKLSFENYLQILVLSIPLLLITGPFLPDLFLTLSSLSFLIYLFFEKKINFLKKKIFYLFSIFFFVLVISSLLSDYKIKSLITSLGYFRFGIFLFVVSYLIKKKKNFIKNLCFILISIFIILLIDSFLQLLSGSNMFGTPAPYGRITSLFGEDIKLGGYIARLTPLLIALLVYLKSNKKIVFIVFLISLFLTLISGERTSFLMLLMFLFGFTVFCNISIKLKLSFLLIPLVLIFIISLNQEFRYRVLTTTMNQINLTKEKPFFKFITTEDGNNIVLNRDSTIFPRIYHMYFETVIKIFKDNYIIGSGPRTYPLKSKEEKYYTVSSHQGWIDFEKNRNSDKEIRGKLYNIHIDQIKKNKNLVNELDFNERLKDEAWQKENHFILLKDGYIIRKFSGFTNLSGVNSHPHNTYLQLLCETGIAGFLYVIVLWFYCIFRVFSKIDLYYKCLLLGLIVNLFPFMFTGNFFNGWLTILYFYPLGFLLDENLKT